MRPLQTSLCLLSGWWGKLSLPKSHPQLLPAHTSTGIRPLWPRGTFLLDRCLKMENLNVFAIKGYYWFKIKKYSWDGAGSVRDSGKQRNAALTQFWFNPSHLQCCSALPVMKFNLKASSPQESQEPNPWGTLLDTQSPGRSQVHTDRTNI